MRRLKVLIADDHRLMLSALRIILDADPEIEVVGEANDGSEVLPLVGRTQPDVVLLDVRMPRMDGLACLEHLALDEPPPARPWPADQLEFGSDRGREALGARSLAGCCPARNDFWVGQGTPDLCGRMRILARDEDAAHRELPACCPPVPGHRERAEHREDHESPHQSAPD